MDTELHLPTEPCGDMAWTAGRGSSPHTPAMAFSCPTESRQKLLPARKGKEELGRRRVFSPQPNQEQKGICQTADVSYSVMLLKQFWSQAHLSGTPLHKDSVFPFKLEGMSVLWPPQPHIFHHKAMTGEAPLGEQ